MKEYRRKYISKEAKVMAKEMLNAPPTWSKFLDLMTKTKEARMIPEAATKRER